MSEEVEHYLQLRDEIQHHTDTLLEKLWECDIELRETLIEVFREKTQEVVDKRITRVRELESRQKERNKEEVRRLNTIITKNWQELLYTLSDDMAFKFSKRHNEMRESCVATFASSLEVVSASKTESALQIASGSTDDFKTLLDDALEMIDTASKEKIENCRNVLTLYDSLLLSQLFTSEGSSSCDDNHHCRILPTRRAEKERAFFKIYDERVKENEAMIEKLRLSDFNNIGCGDLDSLFN